MPVIGVSWWQLQHEHMPPLWLVLVACAVCNVGANAPTALRTWTVGQEAPERFLAEETSITCCCERFGNWWQFINTRAHTTAKSSLTIWEDLLVPYMIVLYAHGCGGEWPLGRLRHRLPRWPTPHPAQRKSHALGQPASSTVSAHRDNQCRSTVVVTASRFKCQAHHPNNPLSAAPMPAGRPPRRTRTITARSALLGCHPPGSALLGCHPWRLPWGPHHQPSWLMKKSRSCDSVGVCTGISGSMDGGNGGSVTSATPSPPFSSSQRRNTAVSGLMGGLAAVRWGQKRSRGAGEEEREVEQERGHAVVATRKKAPS